MKNNTLLNWLVTSQEKYSSQILDLIPLVQETQSFNHNHIHLVYEHHWSYTRAY